MVYQKTWFSYILWAIYAGICIMLLAFVGYFTSIRLFQGTLGFMGGAVIGVLALFPAVAAVYCAIRAIAMAIRKKYTMQLHTASMWEWFIAAFVLVMSILYQLRQTIVWITGMDAQTETALGESAFFRNAMITAAQGAERSADTGGWLYEQCLSVFLSFLGNKVASALFMQLILHILVLVLGYVAIRRSAGRLPGCLVLVSLALTMGSRMDLVVIDPGYFTFVLYLAGLVCVVCYCCRTAQKAKWDVPVLLGAVLTGALIGVISFFNAMAVTLWIFLLGMITVKAGNRTEKENVFSVGERILSVIVPLAGAVAAWFLMAFLYFDGTRMGFYGGMENWYNTYCNMSLFRPFAFDEWNGTMGLLYPGILIALASFLIPEFFRNKKTLNTTGWLLAGLSAAITPFAGNGPYPCRMMSVFFWAVFAGLGLQNCIFGGADEVMVAVLRQINDAAQQITGDSGKQKEAVQIPEQENVKETETEEPAQPEQAEAEKLEKPRFIKNPLPLPKKHVHKEMDYQYPVEEKDMKFDVEVDDNDDFDVQ